jgi:hypothetical protein
MPSCFLFCAQSVRRNRLRLCLTDHVLFDFEAAPPDSRRRSLALVRFGYPVGHSLTALQKRQSRRRLR